MGARPQPHDDDIVPQADDAYEIQRHLRTWFPDSADEKWQTIEDVIRVHGRENRAAILAVLRRYSFDSKLHQIVTAGNTYARQTLETQERAQQDVARAIASLSALDDEHPQLPSLRALETELQQSPFVDAAGEPDVRAIRRPRPGRPHPGVREAHERLRRLGVQEVHRGELLEMMGRLPPAD